MNLSHGMDAEEFARCFVILHYYRCNYFLVLVDKIHIYESCLLRIDEKFDGMDRNCLMRYRDLRSSHNLFIADVQKIIRDLMPLIRLLDDTMKEQTHANLLCQLTDKLIKVNKDLEILKHGWDVERCLIPFSMTMEHFIYKPIEKISPVDATLPQQIILFRSTLDDLEEKSVFHVRKINKS